MSRRPDAGFTLLDTVVAIGIVGTVMASLAVFFVRSATTQHRQADTQVAIQLAAGSMDYVSQLPGDNVLIGRTQEQAGRGGPGPVRFHSHDDGVSGGKPSRLNPAGALWISISSIHVYLRLAYLDWHLDGCDLEFLTWIHALLCIPSRSGH